MGIKLCKKESMEHCDSCGAVMTEYDYDRYGGLCKYCRSKESKQESGVDAITFAEPSFEAATYGLEEISKNDSGEIDVVDGVDSNDSAPALAKKVTALHKKYPEKKYHIIAIGTDADGIEDKSEVIWSDYPEEVSVDEGSDGFAHVWELQAQQAKETLEELTKKFGDADRLGFEIRNYPHAQECDAVVTVDGDPFITAEFEGGTHSGIRWHCFEDDVNDMHLDPSDADGAKKLILAFKEDILDALESLYGFSAIADEGGQRSEKTSRDEVDIADGVDPIWLVEVNWVDPNEDDRLTVVRCDGEDMDDAKTKAVRYLEKERRAYNARAVSAEPEDPAKGEASDGQRTEKTAWTYLVELETLEGAESRQEATEKILKALGYNPGTEGRWYNKDGEEIGIIDALDNTEWDFAVKTCGQLQESTEKQETSTNPRWCVEFGDIYSNVEKEYYDTEEDAKARYDELAERGDIEWVEDPVMEAAEEKTVSYDDYAESVKSILMGREFEYGPETANQFVVDDYKDIVRKNFDAGKGAFTAAADIDDAYMGKE